MTQENKHCYNCKYFYTNLFIYKICHFCHNYNNWIEYQEENNVK